jgi:hypothetical protein
MEENREAAEAVNISHFKRLSNTKFQNYKVAQCINTSCKILLRKKISFCHGIE